jgi:hypothetical protein
MPAGTCTRLAKEQLTTLPEYVAPKQDVVVMAAQLPGMPVVPFQIASQPEARPTRSGSPGSRLARLLHFITKSLLGSDDRPDRPS